VVAPDAVSPIDPPLGIVPLAGTTAIVGIGFTLTVTVAVLLQEPVVPVTV